MEQFIMGAIAMASLSRRCSSCDSGVTRATGCSRCFALSFLLLGVTRAWSWRSRWNGPLEENTGWYWVRLAAFCSSWLRLSTKTAAKRALQRINWPKWLIRSLARQLRTLTYDDLAAVGVQHLAGDVGRIAGGQEDEARGDLPGLAGAAQRRIAAELRDLFGGKRRRE